MNCRPRSASRPSRRLRHPGGPRGPPCCRSRSVAVGLEHDHGPVEQGAGPEDVRARCRRMRQATPRPDEKRRSSSSTSPEGRKARSVTSKSFAARDVEGERLGRPSAPSPASARRRPPAPPRRSRRGARERMAGRRDRQRLEAALRGSAAISGGSGIGRAARRDAVPAEGEAAHLVRPLDRRQRLAVRRSPAPRCRRPPVAGAARRPRRGSAPSGRPRGPTSGARRRRPRRVSHWAVVADRDERAPSGMRQRPERPPKPLARDVSARPERKRARRTRRSGRRGRNAAMGFASTRRAADRLRTAPAAADARPTEAAQPGRRCRRPSPAAARPARHQARGRGGARRRAAARRRPSPRTARPASRSWRRRAPRHRRW